MGIILQNIAWLGIAESSTRILKLLFLVYVARVLGATEFGQFSFALAFVSLFVVLADFGLPPIITREFVNNTRSEKEFSSLFILKIVLGFLALGVIFIVSRFLTSDSAIQQLIFPLAVFVILSNFFDVFFAFFRARQQMKYEAFIKIVQTLLLISAGWYVLFYFSSALSLSYAYAVSAYVAGLFLVLFFHIKILKLSVHFDTHVWRKFIHYSWPVALATSFSAIYNQIDSVMLGYWGQIIETGWYNAAYRIVLVSIVPAGIIAQGFYPALGAAFKKDSKRLQDVFSKWSKITLSLALPIVVGGSMLSPRIITLAYGGEYAPASFALQILFIMAGFVFLYTLFIRILVVANEQKKVAIIMGLGALLNIVLNGLLIPSLSLYGAAIATVVTVFCVFVLSMLATIRWVSIKIFTVQNTSALLGAVVSSGMMYLFLSHKYIISLHVITSIVLGGLVYGACLLGYFASISIYKTLIKKFLPLRQ